MTRVSWRPAVGPPGTSRKLGLFSSLYKIWLPVALEANPISHSDKSDVCSSHCELNGLAEARAIHRLAIQENTADRSLCDRLFIPNNLDIAPHGKRASFENPAQNGNAKLDRDVFDDNVRHLDIISGLPTGRLPQMVTVCLQTEP